MSGKEGYWSGHRHELYRFQFSVSSAGYFLVSAAGKAGDTMTLAMNIPTAGKYDLSAVMTKAPNYGSVQFSQGVHQLQFTVTGKNTASRNYLVEIDYFLLTKTQ